MQLAFSLRHLSYRQLRMRSFKVNANFATTATIECLPAYAAFTYFLSNSAKASVASTPPVMATVRKGAASATVLLVIMIWPDPLLKLLDRRGVDDTPRMPHHNDRAHAHYARFARGVERGAGDSSRPVAPPGRDGS